MGCGTATASKVKLHFYGSVGFVGEMGSANHVLIDSFPDFIAIKLSTTLISRRRGILTLISHLLAINIAMTCSPIQYHNPAFTPISSHR